MPRAPDLAGSALDGRYELLELLGEGSFGRVYRGRDRRLGRVVAVKVIKPWWAEDDAWVERFEREARLLARVSDPGIIRIYDIGEAEEGPYYVTELIEGESLADRLRRGALPAGEARGIAEQLCSALAGAHREGVVHCDVKPANVLLGDDGRVRVADFGVARVAEGTVAVAFDHGGGDAALHVPRAGARAPDERRHRHLQRGRAALRDARRQSRRSRTARVVELGLRHLQDPPPPLPGGAGAAARGRRARARQGAARTLRRRRARWSGRCGRPRMRRGQRPPPGGRRGSEAAGSTRVLEPGAAATRPIVPGAAATRRFSRARRRRGRSTVTRRARECWRRAARRAAPERLSPAWRTAPRRRAWIALALMLVAVAALVVAVVVTPSAGADDRARTAQAAARRGRGARAAAARAAGVLRASLRRPRRGSRSRRAPRRGPTSIATPR